VIIAVKPADGYENATFPTTTTLVSAAPPRNSTTQTTLSTTSSVPTNSNASGTTLANSSDPGKKANPWIGIAIFAIIIAVGIGIYLIISMAGGKK